MPNVSSVESDPSKQLQQACLKLQSKLKAGESYTAEELLSSSPDLASDPVCAAALVLEEYRLRCHLGHSVTPQQYLDRFPQMRDRLQEAFRRDQSPRRADSAPPTVAHEELPRPTPASPPTAAPARIGPYELLEQIGEGGMGVVYKARHVTLGEIYALKAIKGGTRAGNFVIERFIHEAKAASSLDHPNIVRIFLPIDRDKQEYYFTMAYMANGSLADHKKEYTDPRLAATLIEKVARGIHYAHEQGFVHRDLKPSNILLDEKGEPRVSDFGLAKKIDADNQFTRVGATVGTPAYTSPEQSRGAKEQLLPPSDVWSLGVILYELLTARRPFQGETDSAIKHGVERADPDPPRSLRPDLDRGLEAIVLHCLQAEPARRYATAAALADDLHSWLEGGPTQARPEVGMRRIVRLARRHPTLVATTAIVLLLLGCAAGLGFWNAHHRDDRSQGSSATEADRIAAAELERIKQEIHEGGEVSLLGASGLPRWKNTTLGDKRLSITNIKQECLMKTLDPSLIELYPDPPASYTLTARVRVDDGVRNSGFGICVARAERNGPEGIEHYFCTLVLTTSPPQWTPAADGPKQPFALAGLIVRPFFPGDADPARPSDELPRDEISHNTSWQIGRTDFDIAKDQDLKVVVTPERIDAFLSEVPLGNITWDKLRNKTRTQLLLERPANAPPWLPMPMGIGEKAGPLDFKPVVALYVCNGSAFFHHVTIKAFSEQP